MTFHTKNNIILNHMTYSQTIFSHRTPTVQLSKAQNTSKFDYVILSISWPPSCEGVNDTLTTCQESAPIADPNFWTNITEYLDCSEKGPVGSNWTLDTSFEFDDVNVTEMDGNGTFCVAGNPSSEDVFSCTILNHPGTFLILAYYFFQVLF